MFQTLGDRQGAPGLILLLLDAAAFLAVTVGQFQQLFRGPVMTGLDDVLDRIAQFRRYVLVNRQLTGVDDAHVHAVADGVIEKDRVDGFPHGIVAAKRERDVGDTAGNQGMGQGVLDDLDRLDEVQAVAVVLLDAGCDGEDVGIKDDVFGREIQLLGQ